jgi:hypothetical protein
MIESRLRLHRNKKTFRATRPGVASFKHRTDDLNPAGQQPTREPAAAR